MGARNPHAALTLDQLSLWEVHARKPQCCQELSNHIRDAKFTKKVQ